MARPRLDALPGYDPRVIRSRASDTMGTIYGHSRGGVAPQPEVLNRPTGQNFDGLNRYRPDTNDKLIVRERGPVFRKPAYIPPGDGGGNHNWTADGPARDIPTFRFNRNWRPIVGGGHRDMWGQHTNLTTGQAAGNQLAGKSRMRPGRQNQLTVARYRGQSYSQTTKIAGT